MREWSRLIGVVASTQLMVQGLYFICGILIVRRLTVSEYAFYTIATSMLLTMQVLSDGGIAAGVIAQGGRVWQDRIELGKVVATGLALRRRFALISALGLPIMVYFVMRHGASLWTALLIIACLTPTYIANLSDSLLEVAPKLHQAIAPLQKNQVEVAIGRTLLTALSVFTWPICALALLSVGISRTFGNMRLRKIAQQHVDRDQKPDPEYQRNILKVVWRIFPETVYYCISGQITVWAVSFFGSTKAVGELGGLNGMSQATAVLTTVMATLLVPRFARLPDNKPLLVRRFIAAQVGLFLIATFMTIAASVLHTPILALLGKQYAGLKAELTIAFASAGMNLVNLTTNMLLSARGYVVPPAILIAFGIVVQVSLAGIMPLGTVSGAILYAMSTVVCLYGIRVVYFFLQMRNHQEAIA